MFKPKSISTKLPLLKKLKPDFNNSIVLREPELKDSTAFVSFLNGLIEEDSYLTTGPQSEKDEYEYIKSLKDESKKRLGVHLVAVVDGRKIAGVDITNLGNKRELVGELQLYIDREFRGIGLGKYLIKTAEAQAKKLKKLQLLILEVFSNNKVAISLYKKCGYKIWGRLGKSVNHKGKLVDMVYMAKPISRVNE